MLLNPLTFHSPTSSQEAIKLYQSLQNARYQAGGTFLLNSLKLMKRKGTKTPEHVISLRKAADLKGVSATAKELAIKAMTTITELSESDLLKDNFEVFKAVCKNISTKQIRNMATVGGNLTCRYTWTEMPAAMLGLGAQMHFIDAQGQSSVLDAEAFYQAQAKTDKLFTHITIARDKDAKIAYRRIKKSPYVDIPLLSLLISAHIKNNQLTNTRVAINNCVQFAQRDKKLEEFLNSNKISPKLSTDALAHLDDAIYDNRGSDYKKHMFRTSIKSAIDELVKK